MNRDPSILPALDPGLVGREKDVSAIKSQVESMGSVLITGPGGSGKTTLARLAAERLKETFKDGIIWINMGGTLTSPLTTPTAIEAVIHHFHPEAKLPDDPAALTSIYSAVLSDRMAIIVLDDAPPTSQMNRLVPSRPSVCLITSRQSFRLSGVSPYPVATLSEDQAVTMLRGYYADLTNLEAKELVTLCAGLPLALSLAGASLAMSAAERGGRPDVAAYMRALRSAPLGALDTADAHRITISEALRLSELQLSTTEREAWRKLGVFMASFDAPAAEAIAGVTETMLSRLVRLSLLGREDEGRFEMHALVANYARLQLRTEALASLHLAHARHYTAVCELANKQYLNGDTVAGLHLFDRERPQVEAAYAWLNSSLDEASVRQMLALVNAVAYTSNLRFHPHQRIDWFESQLRSARHVGDLKIQAIALGNLGIAYRQLGDARKALEYFEQGQSIHRTLGNRHGEANALGNLGNTHSDLGDVQKAVQYYEQQLILTRKIGDLRGEGNALGNLGNSFRQIGDLEKAIEYCKLQLGIAREIVDRRAEGSALGNLGNSHIALGDVRKAIEYYEQQLIITREIGDLRGEGAALGNLGNSHRQLGDIQKAIKYYEHCLVLHREIGDRRGEGNDLGNLGVSKMKLGEALKAIEYCEQSLVIFREIGDRRGEAAGLWNSALEHDSLGHRAEAFVHAEEALRLFELVKDPSAAIVQARLAEWRSTL